jgi:hypothetical protein
MKYAFSLIDSIVEVHSNFKLLCTPVARCGLQKNMLSINARNEKVTKYATGFSIALKLVVKQEMTLGMAAAANSPAIARIANWLAIGL